MSIIWILLIHMNANPSSLIDGSEIQGLVCYSDPKLVTKPPIIRVPYMFYW